MRKAACIILVALVAPLFARVRCARRASSAPSCPSESTGLAMPLFIWQDMYAADDSKKGIRHR